jgi:hypothetical protein
MKAVSLLLVPAALVASQPWLHRNPQDWTAEDAAQILLASPWAQQAGVTFGIKAEDETAPPPQQLPGAAEAGLAGHGQPETRWDGGVGRLDRYNPPTLNVTVRWDSALPERLAAANAEKGGKQKPTIYSSQDAGKYYIVTIMGLVPAGRYQAAPHADTQSASDDSVDSRNPEQMLQALMANSRLLTHSFSIGAADAKLDSATGTLHLFFPRTRQITVSDKDVVLETRFGSVSLTKKFRLKDMVYAGKLEL